LGLFGFRVFGREGRASLRFHLQQYWSASDIPGDEWGNKEKKAAVSAASIANARRCSDVEYARILESPTEVVEMALENAWALWCYDGKL